MYLMLKVEGSSLECSFTCKNQGKKKARAGEKVMSVVVRREKCYNLMSLNQKGGQSPLKNATFATTSICKKYMLGLSLKNHKLLVKVTGQWRKGNT